MRQHQGKQVVALLSMPAPDGGVVWPLGGLSAALEDEPHRVSLTLQSLKKAGIVHIGRGTARLALRDVRDANAKYLPSPQDMRWASGRVAELRAIGWCAPILPGYREIEQRILALWPDTDLAPQPMTQREIHAALLQEMPELPGHKVSQVLNHMTKSGKMFTTGGAARKVYWPVPREEDLFSMADKALSSTKPVRIAPHPPVVSGFAEAVRIGLAEMGESAGGDVECRATLVVDRDGRITDVFLHL
jgi:hypothetical protein